jgi:hypothetical protein
MQAAVATKGAEVQCAAMRVLLALLLALPAAAAPRFDGGLSGGMVLGGSNSAAVLNARAGVGLGLCAPAVRALGLMGPGYLAWTTGIDLRCAFGTREVQLTLQGGMGFGELLHPDPYASTRTGRVLVWHAGAGVQFRQSETLAASLELQYNHWAGQDALGYGGGVYHAPIGPLFLASIQYSPYFMN